MFDVYYQNVRSYYKLIRNLKIIKFFRIKLKIMKISKKKGIAIGALALTLALLGASAAQADNSNVGGFGRMGKEDHKKELVEALSAKFNLKTADVEQVFTEQHAKMEATRLQELKTKLGADVTAGKITQVQADLIVAKGAEMKTFRDTLKDKTKEEVMAAMKTQKASLDQWIKENNIPAGYLVGGFEGGRGGHRVMMKGGVQK